MFEVLKSRGRIIRHLLNTKGEYMRINAVGTFTPWYVDRDTQGDYLYAVVVARGLTVCPMIVRGGRRDYQRIRDAFMNRLHEDGMRGYHVSVNRVDKL